MMLLGWCRCTLAVHGELSLLLCQVDYTYIKGRTGKENHAMCSSLLLCILAHICARMKQAETEHKNFPPRSALSINPENLFLFFFLSAANDLPRLLKVFRLNDKGSLRSSWTLRSEADGELGILLGREGTLGRLNRERRVAIGSEGRTEIGKTHVFVADLQFRGVLLSEI